MRIAVLSLLVSSSIALGATADETQIRETFSIYRRALQQRDGRKAASQIDQRTLAYYGEVRDLALDADRAALEARPVGDRLIALLLRSQVDAAKLATMSATDVLVFGMEKGWVGAEVGSIELGAVSVNEAQATGEMLLRGAGPQPAPMTKAPVELRFVKEEAGWRLNLLALLEYGNKMLAQTAQRMGVPEQELIVKSVEHATGKPVPPSIWDAPRKTATKKAAAPAKR